MKYNVSKFLIKSIFSTVSVATLTSVFVYGAEESSMLVEDFKGTPKTLCKNDKCIICLDANIKYDKERKIYISIPGGDTKRNEEEVYLLPCGHGFCKKCITSWVVCKQKSNEEIRCPICRTILDDETIKDLVPVSKRICSKITSCIKAYMRVMPPWTCFYHCIFDD